MLAAMSLRKFTPAITSPNTTPLYSVIVLPSMEGVVVRIMFVDFLIIANLAKF